MTSCIVTRKRSFLAAIAERGEDAYGDDQSSSSSHLDPLHKKNVQQNIQRAGKWYKITFFSYPSLSLTHTQSGSIICHILLLLTFHIYYIFFIYIRTLAEETLANQLVIDFENGTLEDCEDSTTLRSYLARKLNCAPMRISKKFAKKQIGKLSFVRRGDNANPITKGTKKRPSRRPVRKQGTLLTIGNVNNIDNNLYPNGQSIDGLDDEDDSDGTGKGNICHLYYFTTSNKTYFYIFWVLVYRWWYHRFLFRH